MESKRRYLDWLRDMVSTATKCLQDAQRRHKCDCDNGLLQFLRENPTNGYLLVDRKSALRSEEYSDADKTRNELAIRPDGPSRVVAVASDTIKVMGDGLKVCNSEGPVAIAFFMDKAKHDSLDVRIENT